MPDADALAHSERLCTMLRDTIAGAGGRIPFSRYLELVLYAPGLGYYSAGSAKFGPAGDFVTAPEISSLFGRSIARAIAPTLATLGEESVVFELGAGTGRLAADVLCELAALGQSPARYWILEVSPDLKARQQARLAALPADLLRRVQWLAALPERPFTGVVLANEVLDALPFERFLVRDSGGCESAWVEVDGDGFALAWDRPAPELRAELDALLGDIASETGAALPVGYEFEICPAARAFVFTLAERLARGLLLFSDYGASRREYYLPERQAGTFLCHHRHQANSDPFYLPGLQDITAWVDFSAVASAGVDAGLDVAGYATQTHFLLGAGIDAVLAAATEEGAKPAHVLHSEAKTLTLPGEMGERFKFLGLGRGLPARPAAFMVRDLAATL